MSTSSPTSQPQAQSQTQPQPSAPRQSQYTHFKRYTAYTFLLASPLLLALPPRKLDIHAAALGTAFLVSANHVAKDASADGRSITDRLRGVVMQSSAPRALGGGPGEKAGEVQRAAREQGQKLEEEMRWARERVADRPGEEEEEEEEKKRQERRGIGQMARRVWMGDEREGWRERRMEEERKALEEGQGYWGLIAQHFKEAWGTDEAGESKGEEKNDDKDREKE